MEKCPKDFLYDSECVTRFDNYQIVHLYWTGQVWKPTKPHNLGGVLWWGVLLQSRKEPWISDLRRYHCSNRRDYEVVEESDCTQEDLKRWYDDSELERAEMLGENTRKDSSFKFSKP
jgi:hypothetical protein